MKLLKGVYKRFSGAGMVVTHHPKQYEFTNLRPGNRKTIVTVIALRMRLVATDTVDKVEIIYL